MTAQGIDPQWVWLIVAVALGIAELIVPGAFLIWIAAAAALTGVIDMVVPIPLPFQFGLFALLAIASVYFGRLWYAAHPVVSSDPLLNDRLARLIGEQVMVVSAIIKGQGRVRVGDGVWSARGPDVAEGAWVRVIGAEGGCLKVEPIAPEIAPPAEPKAGE